MTTCLCAEFLSCAASSFKLVHPYWPCFMLPCYRGSPSALFLCVPDIHTSSLLMQAFCDSRGFQRHVFFFNIMPCQSHFLKDFNSCTFLLFQFQKKHSIFPTNLKHHQAQRCHKPNLVSTQFLFLIKLMYVSYSTVELQINIYPSGVYVGACRIIES